MKEFLISSMEFLGIAWWVEITTDQPRCTYYFGPFFSEAAAKDHQAGYVEDLEKEGAQNIRIEVKRCKPANLTIFEEAIPPAQGKLSSAYTG